MASKRRTTTTQTTTPPAWAEPVLQDIGARTGSALSQTQGRQYTGDFVAGPTPLQRFGLLAQAAQAGLQASNANTMQSIAQGLANEGLPNVQVELPRYNPGEFVWGVSREALPLRQSNPLSYSPFQPRETLGFGDGNLQAAIAAAAAPVLRVAQEQLMPQLTQAAISSGAWGGSAAEQTLPQLIARDVNEALVRQAALTALEDFWRTQEFNQAERQFADMLTLRDRQFVDELNMQDRQFTDTFNRAGQQADRAFDYGAYADYVNNLLQARQLEGVLGAQQVNNRLALANAALGALNTANMGAMVPGETLFNVGSQQQLFRQQALDNALARFNESVSAPWRGMSEATNIMAALAPAFATRRGVEETRTGGLGQVVQAALGLGGLALGANGLGLFGSGGMGALTGAAQNATNLMRMMPTARVPWQPIVLPSGRVG